MVNQTSAFAQSSIKSLQIIETMLVIAVSVFIQFVIHLIPPVNGIPLGQVLLPVFYAPLIAVLLLRPHVGLVGGLLAPAVNYLLTGAPRIEMLPMVTFELLVFITVALLLHKFSKTREFIALASIVSAKIASVILSMLVMPGSINNNIFNSIILAVPGILLLSLLNIAVLRYKGNE